MAFNISPPPQGSLSNEVTLKSVVSYLYRVVKDLNVALNNLDSDNFTSSYQAKIESVVSVRDKAEKLASMLDNNELSKTTDVRSLYQELRDSIVSSASNVTATFTSALDQTQQAITAYVQANYIASDPNSTLEETITSIVNQTANEIRLEFSTIANIDVDGINTMLANFTTYFRFSEAGQEIGKSDSPSSLLLTNEGVKIMDSGVAVLDINGQLATIPTLLISSSLIVGNHKIRKLNSDVTVFEYVG
jgi:hypothetical protein